MPDYSTLAAYLGTVVISVPFALMFYLGGTTLIGRKRSETATASAVAATTGVGLIAGLIVLGLMLLNDTQHVVVSFGDWVHVETPVSEKPFHFAIKFVFDRLSVPFTALTFLLFGTIGVFATKYMHREEGYNRFFTLYSLFLAGMVTAALAGTIETLFFGWELVGLSSALLVGFFHHRPAPVRNAFRVWVVYRISDAALLLAAVVLHHMSSGGDFDKLTGYQHIDGLDVAAWPYGVCRLPANQVFIVGLLLIIAAAGKSALIPFSGWLPRAMEGPTPSSAVFYGALSVHLGAYLLLRLDPLLDASPALSTIVVVLGLCTAIFAALTARVQTDIKSALAFASLTQVGLIVAEIGLGWRYIPLVHILGHACLRTMQFVRAPSVIRDYHAIEYALGDRLPRGSGFLGKFGARAYRFALERGHLDAILDRVFCAPFLGLFRWIDRFERRIAIAVNDGRPKVEAPVATPSLSPVEEHAI